MMIRNFALAIVVMALAPASAHAQGQAPALAAGTTVAKAVLSAEASRTFISAALAEAARHKLVVSVAVVDDGGHLMAFQRMDNAPVGAATVAQAKARTAAQFRMPTRAIGEMVNRIGINMLTTPDMLSLGGGVPIMVQGVMVGAVGVSGGTGEQDLQIIAAGLKALEAGK